MACQADYTKEELLLIKSVRAEFIEEFEKILNSYPKSYQNFMKEIKQQLQKLKEKK